MCVGGDHTIALPLLRTLRERHGPVALVHFDAHLDTWDTYFGAAYTHGTPFRRAWEEGLLREDASIHVGIRGPLFSPEDLVDDAGFGFQIVTALQVLELGIAGIVGAGPRARRATRPMYVSIDIDVLDPAFAPGTGTPEAGGMTSRELLGILRGLRGLRPRRRRRRRGRARLRPRGHHRRGGLARDLRADLVVRRGGPARDRSPRALRGSAEARSEEHRRRRGPVRTREAQPPGVAAEGTGDRRGRALAAGDLGGVRAHARGRRAGGGTERDGGTATWPTAIPTGTDRGHLAEGQHVRRVLRGELRDHVPRVHRGDRASRSSRSASRRRRSGSSSSSSRSTPGTRRRPTCRCSRASGSSARSTATSSRRTPRPSLTSAAQHRRGLRPHRRRRQRRRGRRRLLVHHDRLQHRTRARRAPTSWSAFWDPEWEDELALLRNAANSYLIEITAHDASSAATTSSRRRRASSRC